MYATHAKYRRLIQDYKVRKGCSRCGYNRNPEGLDFHHPDPKKKLGNVSDLVTRRGWAVIWREIVKCEVLCANCHREENSRSHPALATEAV